MTGRCHILRVMTTLLILATAVMVAAGDEVVATGTISGTVTARQSRHIKNTLIYVDGNHGDFAAPPDPIVIDQVNARFVPSRVSILPGTTIDFANNDHGYHTVYSLDGETFDLGAWSPGETRSHTFRKLGVYTLLCKLHPHMVGYVAVVANPFSAWTDDHGTFRIPDVPAGTHVIKVWNARRRAEQLEVEAGEETSVSIVLER